MRNPTSGFSLVELLVAMALTMGIGVAVFQLFHQNERILRDQRVVLETQQAARAVIFQIVDEIRMAGQGTPVLASAYDASPSESTVVILAGSNSSRINLRAGLANVESTVTSPMPLNLTPNATFSLGVPDAALFSGAIGTNPSGRFVYVWGPTNADRWAWARASVSTIANGPQTIEVTVAEMSAGDPVPQFPTRPVISLEECIAIYRDASTGSIRRASATNMVDPANPGWGSANELAANVTELTFSYFDSNGSPLTPTTLANRASIARVEVRVVVESGESLSNGVRSSTTLSARASPRNLSVRSQE